MSVERTISTSHGSSFNILDTGAPDSDSTGYLTLVFLHGYGIPSIGITERIASLAPAEGVRLIAVNRRGYPGSSPYNAAELDNLEHGTLEERAAIYRDEGHHYAHLLDALVQDRTIGAGGAALVAWSIANAHLSATIAAVHELPDAVRERLRKHVKAFIYFEAVPKPMGLSNPSDGYIPADPEASGHWFASYFVHDLALRDVSKLEKQHPDPTRPATDAAEGFYEKCADIVGAGRSDELLFKPDMLPHLRAARDKAMFDGEVRRAWGSPKAAYVWGGSSVWTSVWMAWALEDEYKAREQQKGTPELVFEVIEEGNHYAVFDQPNETLKAFLKC
ncbi:hypothetical protein EV715DRAFT_291442 [Schizophyllum commune]